MKKLKLILIIGIPVILIIKHLTFLFLFGHSLQTSDSNKYQMLFNSNIKRDSVNNIIANKNDTLLFTRINSEVIVLIFKMNKFSNVEINDIEFGKLSRVTLFNMSRFRNISWGNLNLGAYMFQNQINDLVLYLDENSEIYEQEEGNNFKFFRLKSEMIGLGNRNEKNDIFIEPEDKGVFTISFFLLKRGGDFYMILLDNFKTGEPIDFNIAQSIIFLE